MMALETERSTGLEIAVIGMACQFPGAASVEEYWRNLRDGVESVTFFTDEELTAAGVDRRMLGNPAYVKAQAVLDGVDRFDAAFFGYTPREAELIDPQQRLFLERAWEALERSGYDPFSYRGSIGVYAGVSNSSYLLNLLTNRSLGKLVDPLQVLLATDKDFLATRVAYKLNLDGPAVVVQTACSTSLVAVHVACQALLAGECDMALAGGASVGLPQERGYIYQEEGILSRDGHCRTFDAEASGTVSGNGVGLVVLKRLGDALADGDRVEAVIKGSAVNNDGAMKVGYTAPSVEGQAKVIRAALALAEVEPKTITYMEAHGTGTALGDPIEMEALNQVFGATPVEKKSCAIGSVKSNVGHLDAAAGVAGLMKAVLSLRRELLVPSLHFKQPNPKIDFDRGPFYVNTETKPWKTGDAPRRAGVSSLGIGGTNAHVVLEEALETETRRDVSSHELLIISAATANALETATDNLASHLRENPDQNLSDVAFTLQVGRRAFPHRRAVVAEDSAEAARLLESRDPRRVWNAAAPESEPSVAFLFPGQGAQHFDMAKGVYESEPVFSHELDACCELLQSHLGLDLRDVIFSRGEDADGAAERLKQTELAQPAIFAIEYALAKWWMSWGFSPKAMIGHSIGEITAACVADTLSVEDACRLVVERGRLMSRCPRGSMLAVVAAADRVRDFLKGSLSVAAVNASDLTVVSGPSGEVESLGERLSEAGMTYSRIHTSHAFHSPMMDPALEPFSKTIEQIELRPPTIPWVSNVTGDWITADAATDPHYWVRHLREPVLFSSGVRKLLEEPGCVLLEVGPGQTLVSLARRHVESKDNRLMVASLRHPHERGPDMKSLWRSAARLWLAGVGIQWSSQTGRGCKRVELPTYPFERKRYWIEPGAEPSLVVLALQGKRDDLAEWFYVPSWKRAPLVTPRSKTAERSKWCILGDGCGLGLGLAARLQATGHTVARVQAGESYRKLDRHLFNIRPGAREDYDRLLDDLEGGVPHRFVHLFAVTPDGKEIPSRETLDRSLTGSFWSLLHLAQALGDRDLDAVGIDVVTHGLHNVTGEERGDPVAATTLGPVRVIPTEYPSLSCRSIDVTVLDSIRLFDELVSDADDRVVAHRGRHRWVQSFEAARLETPVRKTTRLRKKGVYLVTGGLGGMGLAFAEYLARTVKGRLILVSRSGPSPRKRERIRAVEYIESLGAEVVIEKADVSDFDAMRNVVARAYERFGTIHGVIHGAGVAGGGLIQLKTKETAGAVLAPKVHGAVVLHELFKERKPDFILLCSSLAGVLGGFGQVDYAAANAFLDAFAERLHGVGEDEVTAVDWDTWGQTGMAVDTEVPTEFRDLHEDVLRMGMTNEEGVEVFRRALSSSWPAILVSTRDLQARIAEASRAARISDASREEVRPQLHERPELTNEYEPPRSDRERAMAEIWQELLGIEKVGVSDNFFELGGDSVSALKMTATTKETLKWNIPLVSLYEAPTIEQLVEKLGGPKGEERSLRDSGDRGRARADRMARRKRKRTDTRSPEQQP